MKKITAFLLLFTIVLCCFLQGCKAIDKADAEEKIKDAEDALASAYVAVIGAEKAGANVSSVCERLKIAGELLALANNAFRTGNYSWAYDYALNSISMVKNIVSEAEFLKEEAQKIRGERLFLSAAYSSVGLIFLSVLSLAGWRRLKGFYIKRVLKMKPEVASEDESG